MNIRLVLITILFGYLVNIHAQQNLIFEENFDDNFLQWMHGNSAEYSAQVKDGLYQIKYKQEVGAWYFWQSIPVHPDTSFYIESKITPFLEGRQSVYGLIWGVRDLNNYNAFLVSNQGKTSVVTCRKGKFTRVINWTLTSNYQNNQAHTIAIRKNNGKMRYYLDGKVAFTSRVLPFYGDLLGFVISGKTAAKIDHLTVRQDREINLVEDTLQGFHRENLGTNINSPYAELHPLIAHDGQRLFVTRKGHPQNKGLDKRDDAWVSYKQKDGSWSLLEQLDFPINNNNHNQVISVSPDNNTLLIGNTYNHNGSSKGKGVSISHRKEDGTWEIPKDVIIDNYYNQNPIHSIHLAANKQLLLLSIERNDSYGHLDLYVSFLQKNGRFSQPKNLGATINTTYEEGTPFLAADGKTLYFASSGHGGYGSMDIFVTKRLDDTWRSWTKPQNLGPKINSNKWEAHYSIAASGTKAYFVSNRGEQHIGAEDVYQVVPPLGSRPDPVLLVKGKVFNANTKAPIRAKIIYYDLANNEEKGNALSDSKNGNYQAILPANNQYNFLAFKGGYYPVSQSIEVGKIDEYTEMYITLYLHPIRVGESIPLNNIFFLGKTDELAVNSYPELNRLSIFMDKYPEMTIKLESRTSSKAQNMKAYLVEKGIESKRIILANNPAKNSNFSIVSLVDYDKNIQRRGNFDPNFNAKEIQKGQIFRLNNTFFSADSSYITKQAEKELISLKNFLLKNPLIKIEIGGHTNGLPEHDYCDRLSTNRAKNVSLYLQSAGIPTQQVTYKGYGKRHPIATNETLQGRQLNQRVEIKIIGTSTKEKQKGALVIPSETD
ncbi:OmpA family protein [Aureispira anguillae]|uniref:OmpA family protein n=1 Tax=Aureispira anguillae TaxID=2864201 RepID=A0A916DVG3_9BACT|nr:OmpA family protein [Aureispira anguillae]BDS15114.1 OmpA family protein [Aureispira anguillae]